MASLFRLMKCLFEKESGCNAACRADQSNNNTLQRVGIVDEELDISKRSWKLMSWVCKGAADYRAQEDSYVSTKCEPAEGLGLCLRGAEFREHSPDDETRARKQTRYTSEQDHLPDRLGHAK